MHSIQGTKKHIFGLVNCVAGDCDVIRKHQSANSTCGIMWISSRSIGETVNVVFDRFTKNAVTAKHVNDLSTILLVIQRFNYF